MANKTIFPPFKSPYEKPQMGVIPLRGSEVMGVGCKTLTGLGSTGTPCTGAGASCINDAGS